MSIDCPLRRNALNSPLSPAIQDAEKTLSNAELASLVDAYAACLHLRGIAAGNCVGILSRNSIEYIALLLAIMRIRAVAVPLNIRLSAAELNAQIAQIDLSLLVTDYISRDIRTDASCELAAIDQLLSDQIVSPENAGSVELDLDQVYCICFTSGSDGKPKGAVLTLGNFYFNALGSNENIVLKPGNSWHLSLPLFHVGGIGIVFRCLLAGAQIFVSQSFEPEDINRAIDLAQITHLSLVPSMLTQLLSARRNRPFPNSLESVLVSGAPASQQLRDLILELKIPVVYSYGLTEAASQISATRGGELPDSSVSSGRVLRFRELKVDTDSAGAIGEICVRGEVLFSGYLGDPESAVDSEGWFHTGDMGSLDQQGNLTVLGRKDEMFISGGENIFPLEITNVAEQIAGVLAAAVVAVASENWGSRPVLFVEMDGQHQFSEGKLRGELSQSLAGYKLPDRIFEVDTMPRTALGKIDKQALIRIAESG